MTDTNNKSSASYMVKNKVTQNTAYHSMCSKEHAASLNCITDNYETKDETCSIFFEEYKSCRKLERLARLERNRHG